MENKELKEALLTNLRYSVSQFDSLSLSIAGGALALSLTFIDEVAPIKTAVWIGLLFASQVSFVAAILLSFLGQLISIEQTTADFEKTVNHENPDIRSGTLIKRVNRFTAGAIIVGIFMLVLYCSINIYHLRDEQPKETTLTIHKPLITII